MRYIKVAAGLLLATAPLASRIALAQRAGESAVSSAQDAFGTTIGNETIGIYSAQSARGFSPTEAGNIRLNGLYYDRQGGFSNRLIKSTNIRVGITAQSYPFVAPTGVADYQLRIPGDKQIVSVVTRYGTYNTIMSEADAQVPINEKLSVGLGAGGGYGDSRGSSGDYLTWSGAAIVRWRPADNIEVVPFVSHDVTYDRETTPRIYMAGTVLPTPTDRSVFWGQNWADYASSTTQLGVLSNANWENWRLQLGLYKSSNTQVENTLSSFTNTVNDMATHTFISFPPPSSDSYSGEARISRVFAEGSRRHILRASLRGRDVERIFGGGSQSISGGIARLGVPDFIPRPAFVYGPTGKDHVREEVAGLSYGVLWPKVGEVSIGLQKSFYSRALVNPNLTTSASKSSPLLYNATATGFVMDELAVYGSYTRGLEDGGVAPDRAANPGEAASASITRQADVGIRYAVSPAFKIIAGAFVITKPQFDLDTRNVFTRVGTISHKGVEFSAAGNITSDLTVIGGVVLLRPRLSGTLVDQGIVGRIPSAKSGRSVRLNVQYAVPAISGFSVDAQVQHDGGQYTEATNILKVHSLTSFDAGARYKFMLGKSPASLRAQVFNIANTFEWTVGAGRALQASEPRRFQVQLSVDF